ncbi:stAR-related lipid transfer protein 9 [Spea bombifrons]|uniref:stAR-related lipid transfer protein 9 n=1 Tax=Spea bombifrons TaxID=233779 RepID=UPI002349008D|nr:stAR-related lipid transfer protein 9 [Spea bombifrons]
MANVRVALRVRPLSKREDAEGARIILNVDENVVRIRNVKDGCGDTKERLMEFGFDYCYWSVDVADPKYASQEVVYQDLGTSVLSEAIKGYNVCLFAYGQTGSGKTYTMMGTPTSVGLTPRICEGLFSCDDGSPGSPSSCRIEVSFLEIYNERVRDLLNQSVQKKPYTLRVREHPEKGPYVQGLSQHVVTNYEQVVALLEEGMGNRITAATHIHEASSRSHAIFTIQYTQAMLEDNLPTEIASKINLVDLAGSERASPNYCKDRLTEGSNINRSLVTLGIVISALAQNSQMTSSCQSINSITSDWDSGILGSPIGGGTSGSKRQPYIPYRDSILTWLLKDSLGGNSKTVMITTVSPASSSYNETMSTLRYASNAKNIINKPRVNEDANVKLIRELREEINRLKLVLRSFEMRTSSPSLSDEKEGNLAELVRQNELKIEQLTKDWTDKWTDKKAIMEQCKVDINRGKAGVTIDFSLPHLIAMEDDILSTGVVIYHLREGTTKIGRNDSEHDHDIVLLGEWMEKEHCVISNNSGVVELCPVPGAPCTVNGLEVTEACRLSQGAVIVLGKTHRFRFNHPAEAAILRQRRSDSHASFISSGSLDWLDLSGDFSEANQLNFNESRGTESLNEENQQKLENLKAFYQQQVEEQQRYVQELKKQIEASQIKGEKELEHEQSVINQLMKENEQCLAKEEHRWTAVHQHRRESAAQTEPKTYAEVQNSVQTEDINPSPAEQDRKRLVQLELLQKCSLRKAERNIRRNKVKFHLERIAKKQNLLQAKKNLQQLQAVCWISEDIVKQTCPRVSNAHKSTEKSTTLRRSRSSPSGFAYCRRWTLPYFMPPRPPVSGLLKRKGRYETITSSEFKPRRSFSEECLLKASCNCSKNGNLEYKETSVARTKAQFAEKRTFGSVTNLNKTGICCSTTVLISDPQMTKKRPKMDKAGNRSKGVPNTRPVESPKKRSARVPVSTAIRDPKPKSFKSPSQQAVGGFKKRAVLERSKILQKNEGTKSVEKFTKHAKNPSTVVRVPTEHPSLAVKAVKQELDSSLAIAQKKSGNEVAKISSSADNINQLSSSFPIDTRCKSTERTNSRVLKPATGLLENWREGDESASSDSESFYSIDSLSSAYASALNEQLKIEEQEVNKTQSDQKNSDSEDSQISQDSLMERENRKERLNKRKFFKCKTILNPCSSSQPLAVAQNTEPIVLAGSITSGLSKCFSLDSLADADELSETDSAKELPAEIFWKLQSPRFPMPHSQNQRDVDTTQESKKSTMEINGSFYLNVNQGVSSNYCDPPLVKSFDVYNRTPANVYDVKEVQSDSNMPPLSDICSACKSEDQSPTFEMVVNDVGGDSNHLVPSLHSCPKPFVQVINEDSNQLLLQPLFSQCSKSLPPLHETVSLAIKDDHGSMELVENHNHDLENLDENIEPQTTQNCISIITNNAVNCDFKEVQNQSTKKLSSIILDGHLSNNQAEPASIEQKSLKNSNGVASDFINKADKKRHTSIGIEQLEMIVEGQPTCGEHTDFSIVKENKKELIETLISKPCEEILPKTSTFNTKIINYHKDLNQNVCHVLSCSESSDITPLDKKENGERFPVAQTQGNYEKSYCSDNTSGRAIDQNIKHVANINNQKQFEMTAQCTVTSSQMQDCQSVKKHLFGIQKLTNNETGTTENRNADDCSVADMLVTSTLLHQPVMSDIELRENSYNLPKSLCRSRTESDADSGGSQDFINLNSDSLVRIQKQSEHGTRPNNDICLVVDTGADMCNNLSSTKEDTATVELTDLNNPVASHSPTNASFLHALGSGSFDNCAFSTLDVSLAEQTVEVMETPLKGDEPYSLIPNTSHTTIVEDTCSITVPADNDIGSVLPTASLDETNTELDSVCANLESCHVEHDVEETTFLVSNALFSHKSKLDVVLPPPYSTDQDTVQTQQKYLGVDAEESDDGAGTINDTQGMNKVIYRKANLLQDNCREIVLFTSHEHAVETSLIQTSGHHHEGIPTTLNHSESQPLSEQNHISRPKCICVSDTDENKNEISQFSNQRSDDATLGFSTYDNHNPNDLNVDILEYGYKTGNSPQTTTDSGVLCGQAHMPKSRNSGNHFLILTPMSQDEEMVPSENSTSSHGNFKMSERLKEPSLEVVDKPKQINVSNDNSVIQTDACSEHCSDPAFLNNVAAGKIHTQSPICSDFNDSQSVEMDNIQDHDRRCQKIINEGGAETKHYSGHSCSTACCSSNKQPHECSLNPALTTPTIAIKCDHGHPSVIPAHSFQTLLMECTRLNGAEADISSPRLNENKGVSTEPTHLGEPRAVKPHNYVPSIIAYQTTVIPQCIPTQQENVDDKIYVASKEQPKKKCNVIQELQHETDILRETSADNKEMLNFSSSDINPFVHPWQSEKCGNVRWRQYAFNSASDLSCTRYPARQGDDRILRCSSVDEGLNANNSPFQCHLSSYANARLMSSTLSSIDDPQTAEEPTRMLEDHQYYYNYLLSADSIELSKKNDGSSDGLNPKSENSSGLVDEIMLLYTSESETYNENDARIHCEKETQTKERHRRQNRHQRSYTDVSHIKLSKTRNEYPRRASLSSMQNMSLHLSQLLHETSELLGNLSQHQADFHADPRGSAVDICQRTLRDSSTQTTVDIGIQTDLERTKKGREGNRLLNTSEINIYVKVIGSDSLTQPTENITSSVKLDNHVVPKTQSLPNLHDFASCEKPQGRLFQSAHVRASTPFLNSLKDMSSQTSFSPSARSCGAPAMLHIKKEPIPEISSSSASSAIQAPVYQPRKKPNLNKQNQKLICQGDTIMVDRASSPILTLSASKKPLNKIVPQHDFTSQNILKFFRHQRKKHHSTSEPQINNSSQTETDSECGSFEGSVGAVNKSEHRQSTCRRISEGKKPVHRFGSEACLIKEAYPLDCNRSRSISEVSGIGRLSNDMKCFSLRRRDKADGTSATALNSHHHNVHSPSWEKEILSRNLVKENTSQMPGIPDKKLCNDTDNQNSFTPSFNDSFFKNVSHPISVSEVGGIDLHKDVESVVESECNTEVLLNQDSSSRVSQKTYNYTLQELPMHNKFRNWPGVQYSPTRTGSLIRSSAEYSVTASPTKTETSEACENRTKEIERLQKERAEIMSGIHLELNQQPLTVQLAEAKLSYGIGETDALLRVIQNGKLDGQDTISIKEQLYDRHMKVIESLRKEREERLQSFRRSRSLSPQKQLSTSQASLASLRESDLPSRRREYLQQLRKEVVDNTRIQKSKKPVQCPSEIEMMLRDYQKAREEAKTEIARARDKLRERAEQEKKRIQQSGKPKDDLKLKTLLSTSTLLSNSSISLSSGPTSGYNSSIPANYDKHGQLGDRETSPRSMDHPTVSTRGRSSLRNSHHLPDFENASKSKTADADLIATGKTCPGYIPYTSSPPSSIVSYQEFARLVQVNATSEVMAACSSNLMNLFNYQAASGWRYQCMDRDVLVYYKAFLSATKHGFLGVGIIKRPLHDVWCMVKDIGTRRLYDQSILSAQVHQRASSGIQLVHVVNNMSLCYLKQPRDFCCIAVESKEDNTYSLCFQSLYDESMPRPSNDTVRGEILPSAWVLQADCINGETVTRVIYMVQVDLGAPTIPSRLLSVAAKRQPLVIASLAKFLSK